MTSLELPDSDQARRILTQGLWLQRLRKPAASNVRPALEWALEIAQAGQPLPPLGFIADLGHLAFEPEQRVDVEAILPGVSSGFLRTYEDRVLGRLFADSSWVRACEALRRYQGRDRSRGLAFVVNQFRERADFQGVELSPGVIRSLLENPPEDALQEGWLSMERDGLHPMLPALYQSLLDATRRTAELLGPEDVFELEHRTALDDLGQRLALRQVLQAADRLESMVPRHRPREQTHRHEVPTRLLDEDTYPVGGYSSLSSRGSIESLLQSQLAYMDPADRPDLFDVKYLRDELLYYSRDENQFLRLRRSFVFALYPNLVSTRFKDAALPWQRGILLLGMLVATVRRLADWLGTEALTFVFLFVHDDKTDPLSGERRILQTIFREQIANRSVLLASSTNPAQECEERARRTRCRCVTFSTGEPIIPAGELDVTRVQISGPLPLRDGMMPEGDDPLQAWGQFLKGLLEHLLEPMPPAAR